MRWIPVPKPTDHPKPAKYSIKLYIATTWLLLIVKARIKLHTGRYFINYNHQHINSENKCDTIYKLSFQDSKSKFIFN